jgi:hypothetical protein
MAAFGDSWLFTRDGARANFGWAELLRLKALASATLAGKFDPAPAFRLGQLQPRDGFFAAFPRSVCV